MFGRGGEETYFLEHFGIRVNFIPGITAASDIATSLSIPLTTRGFATSVPYDTSHLVIKTDFDRIAGLFLLSLVYFCSCPISSFFFVMCLGANVLSNT